MQTRYEKATQPQRESIVEWHDDARTEGVVYAEDAQAQIEPSINFDDPDRSAARQAVDTALTSLGERQTVLNREQVIYEALQNGVSYASPDEISEAIDNHEGIYAVGQNQVVTQQALDRERAIMNAASNGRGDHDPIYNPDDAESRITQRETETGIEYSQGQRDALRLALTSEDQTTGIVGSAGAGKTTAMSTIASEASEAGYQVVGLAPSKVASDALAEAGINDVQTLASWHEQQRDVNGPGRYVIVDESGMVSDNDMKQLYDGLRENDRLLLVGDPRQLQPVEAGTSYSQMLQEGVIEYAKIDEIRRQRDPHLLQMTQSFAKGDTETATAIAMEYATEVEPERNENGKITSRERRAAISDETARNYLALDQQTRSDTVVLSGTNDTRGQINRKIREGLIAEGVVDGEHSQTVNVLQKNQHTKSQLEQARYYEPGQVVVMHESREARQYVVDSVDTRQNTVSMHDQTTGETRTESAERVQQRGQMYTTNQLELAAGDRVMFNENNNDTGARNGDSGRVTSVDEHGANIRLDRHDQGDDPIDIHVDKDHGAAVDHGYARTVHKSQGLTENRVIVAGEASIGATAEQGYVATSRERDSLDVITDNTDRLSKNWQKEADRVTARTAMANAEQQRDGAAREQAREQEREQREDPGMRQHNSSKELDQFKRWDLTAHLERDGFERDSKESSRGYDVMRKDDEKLIVTQKGQHQIYSDAHDSSNAGTIIDYEKNQHGRSLGETRQHLREIDGGTAHAAAAERPERERDRSPEKDTEAVAERYNNYDSYKHEDSYLERRGIDAETVDKFDVRQDERGNAVFRHRDVDENRTVGYELKNDQFAGFAAGGERSLAMEKIGESDDISRVVVTESSIDSMSYYQQHRDEIDREGGATVFISTGGAAKNSQLDDIRDVVRRTGADEVRLAHDADITGDQMSARLRDHLVDTQATVERDKPESGKDWNESLQVDQQIEREKAQARQAEQARQQQEQEQQAESTAETDQAQNADAAADHDRDKNQNQQERQAYQPEGRPKKKYEHTNQHEHEDDHGFEAGL